MWYQLTRDVHEWRSCGLMYISFEFWTFVQDMYVWSYAQLQKPEIIVFEALLAIVSNHSEHCSFP